MPSAKKTEKEAFEMKYVDVKNVTVRGDLRARLIKNFSRLHDKIYRSGTAGFRFWHSEICSVFYAKITDDAGNETHSKRFFGEFQQSAVTRYIYCKRKSQVGTPTVFCISLKNRSSALLFIYGKTGKLSGKCGKTKYRKHVSLQKIPSSQH